MLDRMDSEAATGIVTSDAGAFKDMIAGSPQPVRELGLAARALIFEIEPRTVEVVWPRQRTAGYGTGAKKLSEHFCWLAPYTQHLTFGFYYGSELPDPSGAGDGSPQRSAPTRLFTLVQGDDGSTSAVGSVFTAHP